MRVQQLVGGDDDDDDWNAGAGNNNMANDDFQYDASAFDRNNYPMNPPIQ